MSKENEKEYVYFSDKGLAGLKEPKWEEPYVLIMRKHQSNPNKILLDMRYKCNKEFMKMGEQPNKKDNTDERKGR